MDGFGSHTYQWNNEAGEVFWVKYHFKTDQGIKNLTAEPRPSILAGKDPDSHQRDLREAIERGEYPSWTVYVQIMPGGRGGHLPLQPVRPDQGLAARGLPARRFGKLELNRNPENIFAEVEQSIFIPAALRAGHRPVPGQDAPGPPLRVRRRPPLPRRHQRRPPAGEPPARHRGAHQLP
ncbi:hypothetical protein STENM223S_02028 [Streptomyces tendae]